MTVDDDGVKLVTLDEASELTGYSMRTMRKMVREGYLTSHAVEPIRGGWRHWFRRPDVLQAACWWEKAHPRGRPPKSEQRHADTHGRS